MYNIIPLIFLCFAVIRIKNLEKIVTEQNDILKKHLDSDAMQELERFHIKKQKPFSPKVAKIWMITCLIIIVVCITLITLDYINK